VEGPPLCHRARSLESASSRRLEGAVESSCYVDAVSIGIGCAVFTMVALGAALVVSLKIPWARIAIRVAGSWIAAIGMLWLGWTFRGGG